MVSIIVPTYKEAANIVPLVERLHASLSNAAIEYEVIIVDDSSHDGIDAAVYELQARSFPVKLIIRRDERGLSSAVIRGFQEAQGDVLICMDADLSHPPEKIPTLIESLADGKCEFAIGSRYVPGGGTDEQWGLFRYLNSRVATVLARPFTTAKDPLAGFFAIPRRVFDRAEDLNPVGFKIGLELLVKCQCKNIAEIPITFMRREHGKSKMGLKEQWNYLRHLQLLFGFCYGTTSRFLRFCVVGFSGMLIDLTTYAMLLALLQMTYVSRATAIFVAMNWNFLWNRRLTFGCRGTNALFQQYVGFLTSSGCGAIVSWAISTILAPLLPFFRQHLLLAATVGIFAGAITNFVLCDRFIFDRRLTPMRKRRAPQNRHSHVRGSSTLDEEGLYKARAGMQPPGGIDAVS